MKRIKHLENVRPEEIISGKVNLNALLKQCEGYGMGEMASLAFAVGKSMHIKQLAEVCKGIDDKLHGDSYVVNALITGFVSSGGIRDAESALVCSSLPRGGINNDDGWEREDDEAYTEEKTEEFILKASVAYLNTRTDIARFACNLNSKRMLMVCAIALGATLPALDGVKRQSSSVVDDDGVEI